MEVLILTLHIIACIGIVAIVLLQSGKEGMGVIFGGGSSTVFGSTGAGSLLTKITAFLATAFILTSLGYNILTSDSGVQTEPSVFDTPAASTEEAPAKPEAPVEDIAAPPSEENVAPALGDDLATEGSGQ